MTFAAAALIVFAALLGLSRVKAMRAAAGAPLMLLAIGGALAVAGRALALPVAPSDIVAAAAEAGLGALVFVSAAQIRASRFARRCPASFRLTFGGAPLFLILCALSAFILLPQLSVPSALLLGAALMLNGAAFDRRAITSTPAPCALKAAVRAESAAIIAFGAPIAMLLSANAIAPEADEPALAPLFAASLSALKGFALGGVLGLLAGRYLERRRRISGGPAALFAGALAYLLAPLLGGDPVVSAGAAGLLWGEETRSGVGARLQMRRLIEQAVAPAAYFAFGLTLGPRLFEADLLTVLFAVSAATIMRAGPRLAMLQATRLPKESQIFLAWFGGAPGAASALFILSRVDDAMILDHDAFLTIGAVAVVAGVLAARATSKPLATALLRQTAVARRRRLIEA